MIFWTWRSYFIRYQIFENKVWCPVSKKEQSTHFLLSLAYPIDRLDWALFSVVILFHHWFPLLEKVEIWAFILPRNFPVVLIIFTGRGGAGDPPPPRGEGSPRGGAPIPGMNLKCLIQGALNTSMIAQQVTQVKTVCCRAILSRSSTSVSVHRPQVVLHSYHGDDGWVILTIGDWVKKTVLVPHCC